MEKLDYAALHKAGGEIVQLPQDVRDYVFGSTHPDNLTTDFEWVLERLPASVDLRSNATGIHNQYGNSCVGQSIAWAAEMLLKQRNKQAELSPMFIYYNSRRRLSDILGTPIEDVGTNVKLALGMTTTKGMAEEHMWPYYSDHATQPSTAAYDNAAQRVVTRYEVCGINTIQRSRSMIADVKVALASGIPVSFCMNMHRAFYDVVGPMNTHGTQYPYPYVGATDPNFVGAHCMTFVGYDDNLQLFIVANSWGEGWGDNGYWGMPYNRINSLFDVYCIRSINGEMFEIPNKYRSTYPAVDSAYGKVYRLYQAAFNRKPDTGGLNYWIGRYNTDMTIREIAQQFVLSPEWVSMYGSNIPFTDFVTLLYINVLKRAPDEGGLTYWVSRLNAGETRVELLVQFSESEENKTAVQW
jgi:hypothetical protein